MDAFDENTKRYMPLELQGSYQLALQMLYNVEDH